MTKTPFDSLNAGYVQALYEDYARNPASVPEEWRRFFSQGTAPLQAGLLPPEGLGTNGAAGALARAGMAPTEEGEEVLGHELLSVVARATSLIQAFREQGHRLARIDPLGSEPPGHPQLDPSFFGLSMEALDRVPASAVVDTGRDESVADTVRRLREIYSGPIGYEFEHLQNPEEVRWFWHHLENESQVDALDTDEARWLLHRLTQVEGLEQFLHRAYLGQKRFSIEGNDMLVPMLDVAIREARVDGAREIVMGMAHRGRLNVLAHIVGIPYKDVIREFEGGSVKKGQLTVPDPGTGDVKYHHGASGTYQIPDGDEVRVTLAPNPSHLEFVNPVVEGMARVMQFDGDGRDATQDTQAVVPLLIHGDAAFAAEGIVAETLNLAKLEGYTTGGTIHLIVNNQIGFTTRPQDARSTHHASDLAKGYDIPIIRVNADEPVACVSAMRTALAYRKKYRSDIVLDLVGYRRHGHNEGDEPAYTQPVLYQQIEEHPTVRTRWKEKLEQDGVVDEDEARGMADEVAAELRSAQDSVRDEMEEEEPENGAPPPPPDAESPEVESAVEFDTLAEINQIALSFPEGFNVHPKLARSFEDRIETFQPDTELDWAHAETLAFGSLLREGVPVRLTGQDSERGTFSQRHLVLHDVKAGEKTIPLENAGDARFEIYNSPLTETAVLGFEYGYEVGADRDMVLWEAQFGDFVNVAQVIIDQFIAAGRAKWNQFARLTLLLPHGYEGQGPEHSSARLERFLQLCAEDNMRVAYPTTPAQYFHLLRRQAHAKPERPLIVMTPKSLLRHPLARSPVRKLAESRFQEVLDDPQKSNGKEGVTRMVFCSGKVYYDLLETDLREEAAHVALGRIEELYPFPGERIHELVTSYPDLEEVLWAQEEPMNMGALSYVGPRLRGAVPRSLPLRHVSRPERASPAVGKSWEHKAEQERIVRDALGVEEGTGSTGK
ncbi:MAG: 2-oxoglutarate dehydrogenase E1 component [Longimicrobiales bacterium]